MKKQANKYFSEIYQADRCEPLIRAANTGELELAALRRASYPGLDLPDGVLSGVYNIGCWDAKIDQRWGLDWHRNEGIEFTFLESGNLYFSIGSEKFNLKPGSLTVTRPWQSHKVGDPNVSASRLFWLIIDVGVKQPHQEWKWPSWIILSENDLVYLTKILRQNEMPVWKTSGTFYTRYFKELGRCLLESQKEIEHSRLNLLINELLFQILDSFKKGNIELDESLTESLRTVEIFLNHLKTDYEHQWTLEEMAAHCGLGMTSLAKYFKQLSNLTPVNYLIKVRMEAAAKTLIRERRKNVTEIGYECGFSSSQYFATAFKKQYKFSPKDYRANFFLHKTNRILHEVK